MSILSNTYENLDRDANLLNVIVADTDLDTFERVSWIKKEFNFINLSSNFAVNFILEYEKIHVIIISKDISNLEEIIKKANRKGIAVYIIGENLKHPLDNVELERVLEKELKEYLVKKSKEKRIKIFNIKKFLGNVSNRRQQKLLERCKSESARNIDKVSEINKESLSKNLDCDNKLNNNIGDSVLKDSDLNSENLGCTNVKNDKLDKGAVIEKSNTKEEEINIKLNYPEHKFSVETIKAIKQKIIVFTKAKGGVGSTLLSIFLGFTFRKLKTLIIDLNFSEGGGDIGYYLSIPKSPNMINFLDGYSRSAMDNSTFNIKDNLDILQSPPTYTLAKKVELYDIYTLVDVAKKKYHLIIFDLPNYINDMYLGVMDIADIMVLVSDCTIGSIGRLINMNKKFIYDDLEKILVINKSNNDSEIIFNKSQLRQFFNVKEFILIDENKQLKGRSNFGNFNFDSLKNFNCFVNKVLDLLTYD